MPDLPSITISASAVVPPRDSYFITVLGSMNPTIHHLYWYRHIGLINEEELQDAISAAGSSTTPLGSQLQFGKPPISINCQQNQWTIQSQTEGVWPRLIDITSRVFARLNDTPVTGFVLTVQRHIPTKSRDVRSALAARIRALELGFPKGKSFASGIGLNVIEEDYRVLTSIQPSVLGESDLFILYQRQYEAPKGEHFEYFDIGPLVEGRLDSFREAGSLFFHTALEKINSEVDE